MKVLITGATGLLAKSLVLTAPDDINIVTTYHNNKSLGDLHLDITDREEVFDVISQVKPCAVLHCAAEGSVDYAEQEPVKTSIINIDGAENIALACNAAEAIVLYASSNAVYSGYEPPYCETDMLLPVNVYGTIKKEAERVIRYAADDWLIVRPFLLFGYPVPGSRSNWFHTILTALYNDTPLELVDDIFWQVTCANDCAKAIWDILKLSPPKEVYNVAQQELISLYEFGLLIGRVWEFEPDYVRNLITPVSIKKFDIAPRPVNTEFVLDKLHTLLGYNLPTIKKALEVLK